MQSVMATFHDGRLELSGPVDWPDGITVQVTPFEKIDAPALNTPASRSAMTQWPVGFFDGIRADWGDEPFERPPQGEFELREDW